MKTLKDYFIIDSYELTRTGFNGYLIQFGNSYHGYLIPENEFNPLYWLICLRWSKLHSDIALLKNNKLIRSVCNADKKCTLKGVEYPYSVRKYS